MNTLEKLITAGVLLGLVLAAAGCTSTQQRAGVVTVGALGGAAAGGVASKGSTGWTAAGGVVGAGITALAEGRDEGTFQEGVNTGYILANADAAKRLYFLKQKIEQKKAGNDTPSVLRYYTFEGETETKDGRKLVPGKVVVPVLEPSNSKP